ncbi:MAG: uracil phosphoribosyltransferase [Bdellovibrionales bacterium]|nr:uracil phosphoribosyltransferase [Bdellovibrionales bacterium]
MMEHRYGSQVRILETPFYAGLLAKLCHPSTQQPQINHLVHLLYSFLMISVIDEQLTNEEVNLQTRMTTAHPENLLRTRRISPNQRAVTVNLARAGTHPSHICFELLHEVLQPENIRQDHIFAARMVDAGGKIVGTDLRSAKIGGDIKDCVVFFPDPMGATGGTISAAIHHYKNQIPGPAKKFVAINLIVTPESLKRVLTEHPDVQIYALRLDRGLSPQAVLNSVPGTHWDKEKGLNEHQYIVPGGGGFGEIMNNSFV